MRIDQDSSVEEQKPVKQSFFRSLKRDTHWKCLILSLLICGCLAAIAWCRLTVVTRVVNMYNIPFHQTSRASPCEDGYVYIPVAFVVMLYLVYLVECWHCHTRLQLQCKVDVNTVYERIQSMKEAAPIVWWKAVCYHYVRRTRQVTRYRNGDAFTTTQVYYERVNSHTASSCFNFTSSGMKDISKNLTNLECYPATKIKFTKGFSFNVYDAEQDFEEQRAHFFHMHERMDDYMETREGLDLMNVNFKEYMIAFADPDNLPWYVSQVVFWLSSLFMMSWPLRVVIEYKTAYVHFHIHKLFGCNYSETSNCPGQMTRANTMESTDLELNIRNNYSIVPSYSEALLMECSTNERQDYGAVTTPNGSIPLVHLGNSICLAPTMNSNYQPGQSGNYTPGGCVQNGHIAGTIYQNIHPNGYIPLEGGNLVTGRQSANCSSSDTIGSIQHRRRRRKRKRRRQSYNEAIQVHSDSEGTQQTQRQSGRSQSPTTSTPESPSEHDDLTLASRDSSFDMMESEGGDGSSNGQDMTSTAESSRRPSRAALRTLVSLDDTVTVVKDESIQKDTKKEKTVLGMLPMGAPRQFDSPPAYELALAMRRATPPVPTSLPLPGRAVRELPPAASNSHGMTDRTLPATRARVPSYQLERDEVLESGTGPPIRLMETSL